jgi:hypothetical protein
MDDLQKKQLDFLLADFNAMKSEIARRSTLQKAVLTALVAFYAWLYAHISNDVPDLVSVGAAILVPLVAYLFYVRENREIERLASTIKYKVAEPAAKILGVEASGLIPSEAHAKHPDCVKPTQLYDWLFNVAVFLLIPATLLWWFLSSWPR